MPMTLLTDSNKAQQICDPKNRPVEVFSNAD